MRSRSCEAREAFADGLFSIRRLPETFFCKLSGIYLKELVQQAVESDFGRIRFGQAIVRKKTGIPAGTKVVSQAAGTERQVLVAVGDARPPQVDETGDLFIPNHDVWQAVIAMREDEVFIRGACA